MNESTVENTVSTDIVTKFRDARVAVNSQFVGRDDATRAIMAAMVARQHVFMLGPPGTGKSALGRSIASTLSAQFWQYLFSRTTTPDEVFGPLDLNALKEGRYERITKGRLADCVVAFTDEIGKANSTVQNNMLTAINERIFDAGRGPENIALRTVLAASNELPDPKESGAFIDRFLVKLYVDDSATARGDWDAIVTGAKSAGTVGSHVSLDDWDVASAESEKVDPAGAMAALWKIKQDLEASEISHTARRWKAIVSLCKANAWLEGRMATTSGDAALAEHCLWRFPKERERVSEVVADHCSGQAGEARQLATGARELMRQLGDEAELDAIARCVREVSHVVTQIQAMGDPDCDAVAVELENEVKEHKARALAQLGM